MTTLADKLNIDLKEGSLFTKGNLITEISQDKIYLSTLSREGRSIKVTHYTLDHDGIYTEHDNFLIKPSDMAYFSLNQKLEEARL